MKHGNCYAVAAVSKLVSLCFTKSTLSALAWNLLRSRERWYLLIQKRRYLLLLLLVAAGEAAAQTAIERGEPLSTASMVHE